MSRAHQKSAKFLGCLSVNQLNEGMVSHASTEVDLTSATVRAVVRFRAAVSMSLPPLILLPLLMPLLVPSQSLN